MNSNLAFTGSLLQIKVTANTLDENATLRLRKDSGNGNQVVTVTGLTADTFQDVTNTDSITADNTLDYEVITIASAGSDSMAILYISMLGTISVVSSTKFFRKTLSGIGTGIGKRQVHGW